MHTYQRAEMALGLRLQSKAHQQWGMEISKSHTYTDRVVQQSDIAQCQLQAV